jgi:hypothetical protein
VTLHEEIVSLKDRIAKAESDRDTWQASGQKEKYLEAYSMVGALELQLERALDKGRPAAHEKAA